MTPPTADPMLPWLRGRDDAPAYWQMGILWMMLGTGKNTGGQFGSVAISGVVGCGIGSEQRFGLDGRW